MPRARINLNSAQRRIIIQMYEKGVGFRRIADSIRVSPGVVRRALVEFGYDIRPVGRPPKSV